MVTKKVKLLIYKEKQKTLLLVLVFINTCITIIIQTIFITISIKILEKS